MDRTQTVFLFICTYGRPQYLKTCIRSFKNVRIPDNIDFRIGIIDNNKEEACRAWIEKVEKEITNITFSYAHEPNKGIVHARNKALQCALEIKPDVLAFVDDDCIVSRRWLVNGIRGMMKYDADIVTGPCEFILPENTPDYLYQTRRFSKRKRLDGPHNVLSTTRNVLIKYDLFSKYGLKFDEYFNLSGGSDSFLFQQLKDLGHKTTWIQEFSLKEYVPESRANLRWVLKRNFRIGYTSTKRNMILKNRTKLRIVTSSLKKIVPQVIKSIFYYPFNMVSSVQAMEKVAIGFGKISAIYKKGYSEYHNHHGE